MKKITKIRIPKGRYCKECLLLNYDTDWCNMFSDDLNFITGTGNTQKCPNCLKTFPNGAVFELKETK